MTFNCFLFLYSRYPICTRKTNGARGMARVENLMRCETQPNSRSQRNRHSPYPSYLPNIPILEGAACIYTANHKFFSGTLLYDVKLPLSYSCIYLHKISLPKFEAFHNLCPTKNFVENFHI